MDEDFLIAGSTGKEETGGVNVGERPPPTPRPATVRIRWTLPYPTKLLLSTSLVHTRFGRTLAIVKICYFVTQHKPDGDRCYMSDTRLTTRSESSRARSGPCSQILCLQKTRCEPCTAAAIGQDYCRCRGERLPILTSPWTVTQLASVVAANRAHWPHCSNPVDCQTSFSMIKI